MTDHYPPMKTLENTTDAAAGSGSVHRLVRHLDLFSGIGGFALAARMVGGIETVAFCEIDPWARRVLSKNFSGIPIHEDVKTLNPNEYAPIELITGGFPCQPFSTSGRRKGKSDDRWLWPEMLRVIRESRPAWVLGENVANFARMALDDMLSDLEGEGYACRAWNIPACAVQAAPHRRERIWVTAHLASGRRNQWERGGEARPLCENPQWNAETAHQKREELQPLAWPDDPDTRWNQYLALCRGVDDGLPHRVDRLRGLGNAIVPQVAYELMRAICLANAGHLAPPTQDSNEANQ